MAEAATKQRQHDRDLDEIAQRQRNRPNQRIADSQIGGNVAGQSH